MAFSSATKLAEGAGVRTSKLYIRDDSANDYAPPSTWALTVFNAWLASASWQEFGEMETGAKHGTAKGTSITFANGQEFITSETLNGEANILNVNLATWNALRVGEFAIHNKNCDVMYYDSGAIVEDTGVNGSGIIYKNVKLRFHGQNKENDLYKIQIIFDKSVKNADNVMTLFNVVTG
jgi:hypothetical protein